MSVTYPADPAKPYGDRIEAPGGDLTHDEPFVPVYARRGKARGGQGKVRTWMILTPVAVLVLGGIGAMLVMAPDEASAPLAEPARTGPVLSTTPTAAAVAPPTSGSAPAPVVTAPPVVRAAAPLRRIAPAPARREAARTTAPAATPRVTAPATVAPTGPRSYTPAPTGPSAPMMNTAPVAPATPAPTPPPPIIVEPVG